MPTHQPGEVCPSVRRESAHLVPCHFRRLVRYRYGSSTMASPPHEGGAEGGLPDSNDGARPRSRSRSHSRSLSPRGRSRSRSPPRRSSRSRSRSAGSGGGGPPPGGRGGPSPSRSPRPRSRSRSRSPPRGGGGRHAGRGVDGYGRCSCAPAGGGAIVPLLARSATMPSFEFDSRSREP